MSELRKDPIVGRWVIIAKNRAARPQDLFEAANVAGQRALCPFCEGNEIETPHELAAIRRPGTARDAPGWQARVVPNRYPALEAGQQLDRQVVGMHEWMHGVGEHEVIIESPRHITRTTELGQAGLRDVLWLYRERLESLKRDPRLVYGMLFKNVGAAAGASLEHTHSQLIVMPIMPISVVEEMAGSLALYQARGCCVFCEMVAEESRAGERTVVESDSFLAFCPFAARFPFETWVIPKRHASHYETLAAAEAEDLAEVLLGALAKIDAALARPAYNYVIHTAPFDTSDLGHYHWHIEIIPRVTKTAGFEWGTGFYINPVPPEEAAAAMRKQ